jgi:hypothetical protein
MGNVQVVPHSQTKTGQRRIVIGRSVREQTAGYVAEWHNSSSCNGAKVTLSPLPLGESRLPVPKLRGPLMAPEYRSTGSWFGDPIEIEASLGSIPDVFCPPLPLNKVNPARSRLPDPVAITFAPTCSIVITNVACAAGAYKPAAPKNDVSKRPVVKNFDLIPISYWAPIICA